MVRKFNDCILYEIYPNNFKDSNADGYGDIKGIISKLDYVKEMGFDGIWLNPVYDSPFLDGGYDIRDFYKIAERFGTMEDLDNLIKELHARDMILLMDLVPGHVSTTNKEFLKSAESSRNEYSDTFIWTDDPWCWYKDCAPIRGCYDRSGAYIVNFFAHQAAINYGYKEFTHPSWQISYKDERVVSGRKYIENVMKFYLARGVDGFRVDMADSLVKNDDEKDATIWVWQQIRKDLQDEYPNFVMTSEWSNPYQSLQATFDSDFVLDHYHNFSHKLFRERDKDGNTIALLHKYDEKLFRKFRKDIKVRCAAGNAYKGSISVISGNHDTERLANFLTEDELRLAYLFILTMPGVPYIYAGDEIGMKQDNKLPSIEGGYQRTGCRTPMRFDHTKNYGFSDADKTFLPTNEDSPVLSDMLADPNSLTNEIKDLIKIKHELTSLHGDHFMLLDRYYFGYQRNNAKVFINIKDEDLVYTLKEGEKVVYKVNGVEVDDNKVIVKHHGGVLINKD